MLVSTICRLFRTIAYMYSITRVTHISRYANLHCPYGSIRTQQVRVTFGRDLCTGGTTIGKLYNEQCSYIMHYKFTASRVKNETKRKMLSGRKL